MLRIFCVVPSPTAQLRFIADQPAYSWSDWLIEIDELAAKLFKLSIPIRWEAVWSNVMESQPLTTGAVDCLMQLGKETWE